MAMAAMRRQGNYLRVRGEYLVALLRTYPTLELPPRARRIPGSAVAHLSNPGTTSACAENTPHGFGHFWGDRNYLRVRGEYRLRDKESPQWWELPPRARRIHRSIPLGRRPMGTTSACAENTVFSYADQLGQRNYLRVRGEYSSSMYQTSLIAELPPRARRIQQFILPIDLACGTTSACAENTLKILTNLGVNRNYLRVRGEYTKKPEKTSFTVELPPRARRIPHHHDRGVCPGRTTSACAENTWVSKPLMPMVRNYLRVRGEYGGSVRGLSPPMELPPRARRILYLLNLNEVDRGTTSACAENTHRRSKRRGSRRNYLRVRGEY